MFEYFSFLFFSSEKLKDPSELKKRRGEIEVEIQRAVDEGKGLTTTNITLRR